MTAINEGADPQLIAEGFRARYDTLVDIDVNGTDRIAAEAWVAQMDKLIADVDASGIDTQLIFG